MLPEAIFAQELLQHLQILPWLKIGSIIKMRPEESEAERAENAAGELSTGRSRVLVREMFHELKGITGERPLDQEELEKMRSGLYLGFPARFERQTSVSSQLVTLALDGHSPQRYQTWPAQLAAS